jgi:2-polyprenyl-3-methyl-5-hydroxy-6-metoxy-1,4-benzoquinol methylase
MAQQEAKKGKGGSRILRSALLEKLILFVPSAIYLLLLPVIWLVEVSIFLPFILIAAVAVRRRSVADDPAPKTTDYEPKEVLFDRLRDISKITGCNTRNVNYRWSLFAEAINNVKAEAKPDSFPAALDFGAGCLRDTYELAGYGFRVTSCDLNRQAMIEGSRFYDWSSVIAPPNLVSSIADVGSEARFGVITAFDVIEHLYTPEDVLHHLGTLLDHKGVLLVTVPNRLALSEKVFQIMYKIRARQGRLDRVSGAPHVQFRTPAEWKHFFEDNGFSVIRHEMAIGFLVNDMWVNFYAWPCRLFVEPWILSFSAKFGWRYRLNAFEELFYPKWLMAWINCLDLLLKPLLQHRWGWNLFVLGRA